MLLAMLAAAAVAAPDQASPIFFKCRLAEHMLIRNEDPRPIGTYDRFLKVLPGDIRLWSDSRHRWGENWCDHGAACEVSPDAIEVSGGYGDLSLSRSSGTFSSLIRGSDVLLKSTGACTEGPDLHK